MKLSYIDLETTSVDTETTKVIQLWLKKGFDWKSEKEYNTYFSNDWQKITLGCRSITWIEETDLVWKAKFEDSEELKYLKETNFDSVYIAHNGSKFDFPILKRYWVEFKYRIDTLTVSQIILDEYFQELEESFKLGHIYFFFKDKWIITYSKKLSPHDAWDDITILELVFEGLMKIYKEKNPTKTDQQILWDFVNMTHSKRILPRMTFWKHKGIAFHEVDKSYLNWMINNMSDLDEDLKYTIEYYLNWGQSPYLPTVNNIVNSQIEKEETVPDVIIPEMPKIKEKEIEEKVGDIDIEPEKFCFDN